jgi:LacI family transcriptional regulator
VDALVIASSQWTVESFRHIEEQRTRYILVDRQFSGLPANFVGVDDEAVGLMATEHLLDVGCRTLAHIGGPEVSTALGRREGFRKALARRGVELSEQYIVSRQHGDNLADSSGYTAMQKLLQLSPRPDGVFCYNDPAAMGAMKAILEAGLRIPEDVAVVGCGNLRYADNLRVPLSSVDQNSEGIGEQAAGLALSLVESKVPVRPKTILLEPKLVIRDSSRRI